MTTVGGKRYSTSVTGDDVQLSDPEVIGPGTWYTYHTLAYNADTEEKRLFVCWVVRNLCNNFKCEICSGHCKEYIQNNPPERVVRGRYNLFEWTVQFHNAVNRRIGKPEYSLDRAYTVYGDKNYGLCLDCGVEESRVASVGYDVSTTTKPNRMRTNLSDDQLNNIMKHLPGLIEDNRKFR